MAEINAFLLSLLTFVSREDSLTSRPSSQFICSVKSSEIPPGHTWCLWNISSSHHLGHVGGLYFLIPVVELMWLVPTLPGQSHGRDKPSKDLPSLCCDNWQLHRQPGSQREDNDMEPSLGGHVAWMRSKPLSFSATKTVWSCFTERLACLDCYSPSSSLASSLPLKIQSHYSVTIASISVPLSSSRLYGSWEQVLCLINSHLVAA